MNHTNIKHEPIEDKCDCTEKYSIPFLDVLCTIEEGNVITDLYRKETDRNQYLMPESCHPKQTTLAIPYSLGLRIVRICSRPVDRDQHLAELRDLLLARHYNRGLVESALDKARKVPREIALKKRNTRKRNKRPVLATPFDPRLPAITSTFAKHWRSMTTEDSYLKEVFPEPPLTACRKQKKYKGLFNKSKSSTEPANLPKEIFERNEKMWQ